MNTPDQISVEIYNDLVDKYASKIDSIYSVFEKRGIREKLTFGGRFMFKFLRPNLITVEQYVYLQHVCRILRNAVTRFKDMALSSDAWMAQAGLIDRERELVSIYPGYDRLSVTARWDSFMQGDELHFVELNAECPAGIAYQDVAAHVFDDLPFVQDFKKRYNVLRWELRQRLLDELLKAYAFWHGHRKFKKPVIAIVDWKEVPTYTEFQLFEEFFKSKGFTAIIADPRDLEYDGQRLTAHGQAIDLVYKRILTNDCVEKPLETKALVDAYRDLNVCMINPFRAKIVHKKSIFAVLTHEKNQDLFTGEELHIIGKHIPWTRKVQEEMTTLDGHRIDLIECISHEKDKFVIKPNDEYGGKGVYLGKETAQEEWNRLIQKALDGEFYVVQEIVPIPKVPFPVVSNGKLEYHDMVVDMDPYAYGPDVDGVLTRLSASSLANVTAGGGTTPTFVVSPISGASKKTIVTVSKTAAATKRAAKRAGKGRTKSAARKQAKSKKPKFKAKTNRRHKKSIHRKSGKR